MVPLAANNAWTDDEWVEWLERGEALTVDPNTTTIGTPEINDLWTVGLVVE